MKRWCRYPKIRLDMRATQLVPLLLGGKLCDLAIEQMQDAAGASFERFGQV
jgi:hypothetical protein